MRAFGCNRDDVTKQAHDLDRQINMSDTCMLQRCTLVRPLTSGEWLQHYMVSISLQLLKRNAFGVKRMAPHPTLAYCEFIDHYRKYNNVKHTNRPFTLIFRGTIRGNYKKKIFFFNYT